MGCFVNFIVCSKNTNFIDEFQPIVGFNFKENTLYPFSYRIAIFAAH